MHLPVKAHYATLAMLALAQRFEAGELLPARAIANDHQIPTQFLGQILQQLRATGLISSTRGSSGGFTLQRAPDNISIAEIVDALCTSTPTTNACNGSSPLSETVQEVWDELQSKQREILENLTLGDLLKRTVDSQPMFYI